MIFEIIVNDNLPTLFLENVDAEKTETIKVNETEYESKLNVELLKQLMNEETRKSENDNEFPVSQKNFISENEIFDFDLEDIEIKEMNINKLIENRENHMSKKKHPCWTYDELKEKAYSIGENDGNEYAIKLVEECMK